MSFGNGQVSPSLLASAMRNGFTEATLRGLMSPLPPDSSLVVAIDPNAPNNLGLVRCYKIQLWILDKHVLLTIRDHITQDSLKTFLAYKHNIAFQEKKSAPIVLSGLILLCKIIKISKSKTIVEVCHL
jgi:hypothetical protein